MGGTSWGVATHQGNRRKHFYAHQIFLQPGSVRRSVIGRAGRAAMGMRRHPRGDSAFVGVTPTLAGVAYQPAAILNSIPGIAH